MFADYLTDNYIDKNSLFPPHICIFGQLHYHRLHLQQMPVNHFTVDLIEFYHPHPQVFKFIKVLTDFQTDSYIRLSTIEYNTCTSPNDK